MKKIRAIVFLFRGEDVTELLLSKMGLMIKNHCELDDNDEVNVTVKNGSEISKIIGDHLEDLKDPEKGICKTKEDNAVFYIGKVMSKYLGKNYNPLFFSSELLRRVAKACEDPKQGSNKEFLNALRILDQPQVEVSETILKEVNMTKEIIELIQELVGRIVDFNE
jgi:hypothetical protein